MSAQEYYQSTPGQEFQSQDSFWKGGNPASVGLGDDIQSPPLRSRPRPPHRNGGDGGLEDYFSPQPPGFSLTDFPPSGHNPVDSPTKPIPIPPPQVSAHNNIQSPPIESPDGGLTDDSDGSLVHIHHPSHNSHHITPPPTKHPNNGHQHRRSHSDTLSLTHLNLQQHNGISGSSAVISPPRDYGGLGSTRKRLRAKELATHGKDTLIQMLIRQEIQFDESRKLLRNAMEKLEQYKLDLLEANNHCRRLERACQKLTDERMMMHTQVTEGVAKARLETDAARQELSVCKLRLEHTELALTNANVESREMKAQRDTARAEAEDLRKEAHRLREENQVRLAREMGRQEGFKEGVEQGRVVGASQSGGGATPRQIVQAGIEPANASTSIATNTGANEPSVENPNTSLSSSTTSHRRSSGSSHRSRVSQAEFAEAVERARRETEARLQHELELRLAQERDRLKLRNLELEQQRQKEIQEATDRMRAEVEQLRRQEAVEVARLRERDNQREEEARAERERVRELELEKEKERELREREQQERQRERAERERERATLTEKAERERQRLEEARDRDRQAALERDRERDRAVTEATAQAALAAANANAAASANAARSTSETSDSGSDARPSSLRSYLRDSDSPIPPQPYIPMPRPPFSMPMPTPAPASSIIAPTMSMPEPTMGSSMVNTRPSSRGTSQPNLPTTVPARRSRRASMDSESSNNSTMAGFDSLVSFPVGISSSGPGTRVIPGYAGSGGSNGQSHRLPPGPTTRNNTYTRPTVVGAGNGPYVGGREILRDIPEDASLRMSSPEVSIGHSAGGRAGGGGHMSGPVVPPLPVVFSTTPSTASSSQRRKKEQVPAWVPDSARGESSSQQFPVVPGIRVDHPNSWSSESSGGGRYMSTTDQQINSRYLNPNQTNLRRSDSTNSARPSITSISSYNIEVEPPSNPTSPRTGRHGPSNEQPPPQNQFLSPNQQPVPIPQVQTQPVLPRRADSPPLPVRITNNSSSASDPRQRLRAVSGQGDPSTEPNSPVMPTLDAHSLPPGFVPHVFTPHSATPAALPADLPPGFMPQAITNSVTGMTTPLAGLANLPAVGAGSSGGTGGGGPNSRRQSAYGNPNAETQDDGGAADWGGGGWGSARPSPYTSSSPLPSGPPVIPRGIFDDLDGSEGAGPSASRATPSQRPRSIFGSGTPGASSRNLPGNGTPAGGGVYQNPLRQEEGEDGEGETDDLLARNTRINATAPAPALAAKGGKKKKKGGR